MPKGVYKRTPDMMTGKYPRKLETRMKISNSIRLITKRGPESNLWKGKYYDGSDKHGYFQFEYKQWRWNVFIRDNFTCQHCGNKGYVTAHHIQSWAHHKDLRFDINNGITLCEICHKKTDNYKGRGYDYKITIQEQKKRWRLNNQEHIREYKKRYRLRKKLLSEAA